jgi:hypothetical protein
MAANKILAETTAFLNFAVDGFKYNLQVLPDVLTSSALLFSILFQSPPMAILAVSLASVSILHSTVAGFMGRMLPNMIQPPSDADRCSGHFPGVSYSDLLGIGSLSSVMNLAGKNWPSYYSTFIGFLAGWVGTLPSIYAKEIEASPQRLAAVTGGLVVLGLMCVIVMIYRITSACETFGSTSLGLTSGFAMGFAIVMFVAWVTERRGTNILGMPLLRGKAEDGKPIYVCERPDKGATADDA